MLLRMLVGFMLVTMLESTLLAQQNEAPIKLGDLIEIEMTGEVVREYGRLTNMLPKGPLPERFSIGSTARVEQKLKGGRLRIEHSAYVNDNGKPTRLVTLSGLVDPRAIKSGSTAKGTLIYDVPGATGRPAPSEARWKRLELAELKGLTLRTWTLAEEVAK